MYNFNNTLINLYVIALLSMTWSMLTGDGGTGDLKGSFTTQWLVGEEQLHSCSGMKGRAASQSLREEGKISFIVAWGRREEQLDSDWLGEGEQFHSDWRRAGLGRGWSTDRLVMVSSFTTTSFWRECSFTVADIFSLKFQQCSIHGIGGTLHSMVGGKSFVSWSSSGQKFTQNIFRTGQTFQSFEEVNQAIFINF